jgi:succinoglycan biosynthesis transport protein ExoP
MDELQASIRDQEQLIADSYANEYHSAKARESELAATMATLIGEAGTNSQAQVRMRELEGSADTLRSLYNSFLQKYKEINAIQNQNIPIENARIITRAAPPLYRSSKKRMVVLVASIVGGCFLGAGVAVGREWVADTFRTSKMVEQVTNIYCVILPDVKPSPAQPIQEFVLEAPYSRFTETLRNVKALISGAQLADGVKVIGVVSSVAKEGKTTVAANLAALIAAESVSRTLFIDTDLHLRPPASRTAEASQGLIEALSEPSRLAEMVSERKRSGLYVLSTGASTPVRSAAELLGSPKMERLFYAARENYDYIIIEIAPIMSVVDVKLLERFIDRFIFVVEWGQTKRRLVVDAMAEAQAIRSRFLAVVLNKADSFALRSIEAYKGKRFGDYYQE